MENSAAGVDPAPTELRFRGRTVRLKWHKLRQRGGDAPFSRANLRRGLAAGACIEIDLRRLATGEFVCLHDDRLESETTGSGPVNAADREAVSRLRMRDAPREPPLFLDEVCAIMRSEPLHSSTLLHLDLKIGASEIDDRAQTAMRELQYRRRGVCPARRRHLDGGPECECKP